VTEIAPTYQAEIVISHGDTFLVTERAGQVRSGRAGLYHRDVRYLDRYHFTLNGADPVLLTATNTDFHRSRSYLTNPRLGGYRTEIPAGLLLIELTREIEKERFVEEWEIRSFARREARFTLAITLSASFEDLFEVRGLEQAHPRVVFARWDDALRELSFRYRDRDFERELRMTFTCDKDDRLRYSTDQIAIDHVLAPRAMWRLRCETSFHDPDASGSDVRAPTEEADAEGPEHLHKLLPYPDLRCGDQMVVRAWAQARADITALHLRPVAGSYLPAAGVPWFATLFGRDALITGYQLVHGNAGPARASLLRLAEFQYDGPVDPAREAEPGKMPHELRDGELAHIRVPPQRPAYTTADATLLYPILLHETWKWTDDRELVRKLMPVAERCLEWAARYGDRDGDGLQEFLRTPGQRGYRQMGWKDSDGACVDEAGQIPDGPYALVELQGYWYDALLRVAELRERVLETGGDDLRRQAQALRARIEDLFWMDDAGFYAFGLDGAKRQIRSVVSNPGHLLWSGVPAADRAARVADRFFAEDMWSGWGIRTLSHDNPAYNPIAYHRGTVWPHDNSIIAAGLARYGRREYAAHVAEAILAAAVRFEHGSLPELWSGVPRTRASVPVPYLDANRPQAWAAATPPFLIRSVLGLDADPVARRLIVDAAVPRALGELELVGLEILGARVHLRARERDVDVVKIEGDVEVTRAAR
jgi:glycogen debranching enzyme